MPSPKGKYCHNPECSYLSEELNKNQVPKRLGHNDTHQLCIRCLGADHNVRSCGICKQFHQRTRNQRAMAVAAFVRTGVWPLTVNSKSLDKERSRTRERSLSKSSSSKPSKADLMAESMTELAKSYQAKGFKTHKRSRSIKPSEPLVPTLIPPR